MRNLPSLCNGNHLEGQCFLTMPPGLVRLRASAVATALLVILLRKRNEVAARQKEEERRHCLQGNV